MHREPLLPTPRNSYTMPPPLMPRYPPIHAYPPPPRPHHMRAQSNFNQPPLMPHYPPIHAHPPPPRPHHMQAQSNSNQSQRTNDSQPIQTNSTAANPKPKHQDSLKIAIKQIDDNGTAPDVNTVLKTFSELNLFLNKLIPIPQGYLAIPDKPSDADFILSSRVSNALEKINLKPIIPHEIRARRTLMARNLDTSIGQHTPMEIKAEITNVRKDLKIDRITKFPNRTRYFLIHCGDHNTTQTLLNEGFRAFAISVKPDQITQKEPDNIMMCYKCYKYNSHLTKDCKETTKICSNCAKTGHTHTEKKCGDYQDCCINCQKNNKPSNHHTLSPACPIRKGLLHKTKHAAEQIDNVTSPPQQQSYSNAVKNSQQTQPSVQPTVHPVNQSDSNTKTFGYEDMVKIFTVTVTACLNPNITQDNYNSFVEDSIQLNFDTKVKLPARTIIDRTANDLFTNFREQFAIPSFLQEATTTTGNTVPQPAAALPTDPTPTIEQPQISPMITQSSDTVESNSAEEITPAIQKNTNSASETPPSPNTAKVQSPPLANPASDDFSPNTSEHNTNSSQSFTSEDESLNSGQRTPEPSPSKHNTSTEHSDVEQNDTNSDDSEQEEYNDAQTTPIQLKNKFESLSPENYPDIPMTIREHTRQLGRKIKVMTNSLNTPTTSRQTTKRKTISPITTEKPQAQSSPVQNPPKKPHK